LTLRLLFRWALPLVAVLLTGCAQQRLLEQAQLQLRAGNYEQAIALVTEASARYPESAPVRAASTSLRSEALNRLVAEAADLRSRGQLDDAKTTLDRALLFDASGSRVKSLLADLLVERRQQDAVKTAKALMDKQQWSAAQKEIAESLKDNRRQPDLLALQRQIDARIRQSQTRSAMALAEERPISLDFRDAGLRTVLDVVTRSSGVNFIIDKDVKGDVRVSVYLRSVRLEDAIDLIANTHGLAKKLVDERTVLIYPNTPEKQREYQEQIVRVFHLASAEAKGAAAFLKSMIRIREPFVDERANFIAIRESPENIELAERLISLYDSQDAEVLLDLEVIEIRTTRLLDLGIKVPDAVSLSLLPPIGGLNLGNLSALTRANVAVGIGGALLTFKREVGDYNTLANPRIRAKNKEKARVLIGDKVPVITATTGQGGFVADTVSYLDVGLKLDVEPTVYADDDVAIKVVLEVSSVAREIRTNSGTLAYQIGTRNASTTLRLRDGETQLLAGLISNEDRSSATRVPGLGDLPVAGRLFSSQRDDSNRTELVLAITPRILRNIRQPDASEAELWVGTEANTRLRPPGGRPVQVQALAAKDAPAVPEVAKASPSALPLPNAANAPLVVAAAPMAPAAGVLQLKLVAPTDVKVGDVFDVRLDLTSGVLLRGGPLQLAFDASRLTVLEVREGDYFKQGATPTSFTQNVDQSTGRADFGVLRSPASGTVGQGSVVILTFKAAASGPSVVELRSFQPVVVGDASLPPAINPSVTIDVK
jgi:general secretion pathway protein D